MTYSFQFRDVFAAWEFLLDGLILTLLLSAVTMVVGLAIGAAARVYGGPWLRRFVSGERQDRQAAPEVARHAAQPAADAVGLQLGARHSSGAFSSSPA